MRDDTNDGHREILLLLKGSKKEAQMHIGYQGDGRIDTLNWQYSGEN